MRHRLLTTDIRYRTGIREVQGGRSAAESYLRAGQDRPAEHVPGHDRGEPMVAVGGGEVLHEAFWVEPYPGGDLR